MADCKTCRHNYKPKDCEPRCNRMCDGISEFEPQTNADHIRSLSDEELAEWFAETVGCKLCDRIGLCRGVSECKEAYLQWLKSEVKE